MTNSNHKKKVLVVDDDEGLRTVLVDKFNISGFEAVGANDGEDGLKKALEIQPDVILLDIMMPKLDGWGMLGQLRQDHWGKDAKVIMLTVLEDVSDIARAMEKESFDYIVKTQHSLDEIVTQVEGMIKK